VPVSGSAVSRRGAEVAIALARASGWSLHALYVSTTRDSGGYRSATGASLFQEESILKDIVSLASRYGVDVVTSIQANAAPEEAILREILRSRSNIVVMGADRIRGDTLNFGGVASAILQRSDVSVVLVSGGEPASWSSR
jgi:nucleotide-binding universal stress UspA family protein